MSAGFYETDRALAEYLLFHYGEPEVALPAFLAGAGELNFPARCVAECLDSSRLPAKARALDLGCAVGRGSFELARHCGRVVGIDYSERFISTATHLQKNGSFLFSFIEEGELTRSCQAVLPVEIDWGRVRFERGDAMDLRGDIGGFDVVLMANLIDRLSNPRRCLERVAWLVRPGGQLIITSPYTWLSEYTPRENWLGGFECDGRKVKTLDALKDVLLPHFKYNFARDIPFVIREHARKFQLGIAEASVWLRK